MVSFVVFVISVGDRESTLPIAVLEGLTTEQSVYFMETNRYRNNLSDIFGSLPDKHNH